MNERRGFYERREHERGKWVKLMSKRLQTPTLLLSSSNLICMLHSTDQFIRDGIQRLISDPGKTAKTTREGNSSAARPISPARKEAVPQMNERANQWRCTDVDDHSSGDWRLCCEKLESPKKWMKHNHWGWISNSDDSRIKALHPHCPTFHEIMGRIMRKDYF